MSASPNKRRIETILSDGQLKEVIVEFEKERVKRVLADEERAKKKALEEEERAKVNEAGDAVGGFLFLIIIGLLVAWCID
ncbi:MAG: hypothetical protein OYH77_06400 [Pseudomonadota bacterium]|nr:hypothetical protein [Pseudomonadota bacterium]